MEPTNHRRARRSGEQSRALIRQALRGRQIHGEPSPTIADLATATQLAPSTVHHHLKWMEKHGQVRIVFRREIILLDEAQSPDASEPQP